MINSSSRLQLIEDQWCTSHHPSTAERTKLVALASFAAGSSTQHRPLRDSAYDEDAQIVQSTTKSGTVPLQTTGPSNIASLLNELQTSHDTTIDSDPDWKAPGSQPAGALLLRNNPAFRPEEVQPSHQITTHVQPPRVIPAQPSVQGELLDLVSQLAQRRYPVPGCKVTPWEAAFLSGHCSAMQRHLAHAPDVDGTVFGWATPLMCACYMGSAAVAAEVLAAGADANKCARLASLHTPDSR